MCVVVPKEREGLTVYFERRSCIFISWKDDCSSASRIVEGRSPKNLKRRSVNGKNNLQREIFQNLIFQNQQIFQLSLIVYRIPALSHCLLPPHYTNCLLGFFVVNFKRGGSTKGPGERKTRRHESGRKDRYSNPIICVACVCAFVLWSNLILPSWMTDRIHGQAWWSCRIHFRWLPHANDGATWHEARYLYQILAPYLCSWTNVFMYRGIKESHPPAHSPSTSTILIPKP